MLRDYEEYLTYIETKYIRRGVGVNLKDKSKQETLVYLENMLYLNDLLIQSKSSYTVKDILYETEDSYVERLRQSIKKDYEGLWHEELERLREQPEEAGKITLPIVTMKIGLRVEEHASEEDAIREFTEDVDLVKREYYEEETYEKEEDTEEVESESEWILEEESYDVETEASHFEGDSSLLEEEEDEDIDLERLEVVEREYIKETKVETSEFEEEYYEFGGLEVGTTFGIDETDVDDSYYSEDKDDYYEDDEDILGDVLKDAEETCGYVRKEIDMTDLKEKLESNSFDPFSALLARNKEEEEKRKLEEEEEEAAKYEEEEDYYTEEETTTQELEEVEEDVWGAESFVTPLPEKEGLYSPNTDRKEDRRMNQERRQVKVDYDRNVQYQNQYNQQQYQQQQQQQQQYQQKRQQQYQQQQYQQQQYQQQQKQQQQKPIERSKDVEFTSKILKGIGRFFK